LPVLAEFSVKLCELIQEKGASPEAFERGSANLVAQYGRALALDSKELPEVMKILHRKLNGFGLINGVRVFTSPLIKNIGLLASQGERVAGSSATGGAARPAAAPQPKEILLSGISKVAQLAAARPVDFAKVLDATRRCIQSALQLTHCVVFLKEAEGPLLAARVGGGPLYDQIRGRPLVDPNKNEVFRTALHQGEDVLIQNINDPKIWPLIPDWLRAVGRNRTLILLPIRDETGTFALILGVSELLLPLELAAQFKQQLKFLRGHIALVRSLV
jgi:hypothetical protein